MDHLVARQASPGYGPERSETKNAPLGHRPALARSSPREEERDDFAFRSWELPTITEMHVQSLERRARSRLVDTNASCLRGNYRSPYVHRRSVPWRAELRSVRSKS